MRRLLGPALLVVGGVAVALIALEIGLRVLYPQVGIFARHDVLGMAPRAGLDIRKAYGSHERVVRVSTNSLGLREAELGPPPADALRVLAVGDSMTFGDAVEQDEAWPRQLAAALSAAAGGRRVAAVNAGIGGYGTGQELLLYRMLRDRVRPEVVVLGLSAVNDLLDNLCIEEASYRPKSNAPCFRLERGDLILHPVRHEDPPAEASPLSFRSRVVEFFTAQAKRATVWNPQLASLLRTAGVVKGLPYVPGTIASWYDPKLSEPGWELTRRLLLEFRATVERDGARLLVLLIPSSVQLDPGKVRLLQILGGDSAAVQAYLADPDRPQRLVAAFCEESGLACVDLLPALREAKGRGETLFFPIDQHLTPAGHRLAARLLAGRIAELGWIDERPAVAGRPAPMAGLPGPPAGEGRR